MGNRLKELREERRWTLEDMAQRMGMSRSGYIKLERGERHLGERHIQKAAEVFQVIPADVIGPPEPRFYVPIVGHAGAGPEGSVLFATGDTNFGEVPAPLDASSHTEALEVKGDSMRGLANDGWLIFYDERTSPLREYMGEPCVCWLADERVLIKIPYPGSQPGLFHLESVNAPTMRDVPVESMALITDIKTRRAAERFVRRNPHREVQDLVVPRRG